MVVHTLPTNDENFNIGCLAYEIVTPKSISYKSCLVNFNNKIGTIGESSL